MKSTLFAAALLSIPVLGQAFDNEPASSAPIPERALPIYVDRHDRFRNPDEAETENFDLDYDQRSRDRGLKGFHPTKDQIQVSITHVLHSGKNHVQSLQLPPVSLVSGKKVMVKINDRRYRVFAEVTPQGRVDISLAYLKRSDFAPESTLLMEKKVSLRPEKPGSILFGPEEFRLTASVTSREDNQWVHLQHPTGRIHRSWLDD